MSSFFVVGAYEDFRINVFPSHISPIVAELHMGQYRRWAYRIDVPYKIIPTHAVGRFYSSIDEMFPYMTYSITSPVLLREDSQVVAISKNKLLVEHRDFIMCCKIFIEAIKNFKSIGYVYRSYISIRNCLS